MEPNSITQKKKAKRAREGYDEEDNGVNTIDKEILASSIVRHYWDIGCADGVRRDFAAAVFDLGLKHSSPKVLIPLMPTDSDLSTEHIKSHLQKYRIHRQRSKEEFYTFYDNHIRDSFAEWESLRQWERIFSPVVNQPKVTSATRIKLSTLITTESQNEQSSQNTSSVVQLQSKLKRLQEIEDSLGQCLNSITDWKELGDGVLQDGTKTLNELSASLLKISDESTTFIE